ncbi:spermatogenesis associated factor, putative [Pediculus humanus corporis]|uniref:Spermatogenesis associated factor, putative n=1 Tax=Pediculus humanus subsp. corporis TaxID=121224 RepID=E0VNV0_PEDHC|nr:spermatogenesis associated factor, putative [Pediculus humanus corporis]EEB15056.1 spermatogenesis associated factor, putative [Pediculus humanus corporis]
MAKGILIHGPNGCGKSSLMELISEYFSISTIKIDCSKIFSAISGETEKELHGSFERAKKKAPSIILIDDLHLLCSTTNSSSYHEKRIIATLAFLIDQLSNLNLPIVVLAATSKIHQIDKLLRSSSRFGKEVEITVPTNSQRFEILNILLLNVNHNLVESDVKTVADSTHGFVGADLLSLVSQAMLRNYKTENKTGTVSANDFEWALNKVKPSAMKEIMVDIPNVRWEDIGGLEDLKLKLRQCVEWPLKHKESFNKLGITAPKGLLMFGPPGCSKTMIAKALATESKLNFISVKGPELFNKWVGESERAVRNIFRKARQNAPSIIFIDELDAIGGERNLSSGSNVQERVLAQILIEMDGVVPLDNVTVIAATNRLDRIDSALLRPGRLDQSTQGYSGAEIVAVCREAALKALEENFNADKVSKNHFLKALEIILPRTPKNLLLIYFL